MLEDRLIDVEEHRRDHRVRALVAAALSERGRALDVDEHEHPLLAHRPVIAPEHEVRERAPADHAAHLQELRDQEEDHEGEERVAQPRQAEVVEAGALEAVQQPEDQAVEREAQDDDRGEQTGPARVVRPKPSRRSQAPRGPWT